MSKQGEDGAWRSETYGYLKDGYALTPIVLSTLMFVPPDPKIRPAYERGSSFLATLDEKTHLDYPVYSLAGAILVLSTPPNLEHQAAREKMIALLRERQLDEQNNWSRQDVSYGGWGYFPRLPKRPPGELPPDEMLSSNLTSTMFAIGALALAGVPLDDPLYGKARRFTERCQGEDGGFHFTPANDVQNKAGGTGGRYLSYGTATADGIRALLRTGVDRDDPRLLRATKWLLDRFEVDRVPGDYQSDREVQRDSAYHYYAWTVAHALMLLGPRALEHPRTARWPEELARALLRRQRPDGSWRNSATDLREDDPLVATPLAAAALAICRMMLGDRVRTSFEM